MAEAEELVGYGLYLDLIGPAAAGKPRHEFPLGGGGGALPNALRAEPPKGRRVALVCSGDPGIYALATLVFELLEHAADPSLGAGRRDGQPRGVGAAGRGRPRRRAARP